MNARSGRLLQFATMLTGSRHEAEDLLQTCLAKTYLAWPRIKNREGAEAYVRRTLVTTNISGWRRRRNREVTVPQVPEHTGDPGSSAVDDRLTLWPRICALPVRQRTVIVLRYYEGMTEAETARLMHCSVGTVKSYSSRALSALRADLTPTSNSTSRQES